MRKTAPIISKYRPEFDNIRQILAIFSPSIRPSNELTTYPSIATITKLCKL